ncbi:MAG: autotransporter outer membrane beta-barrel domain-containing protein, partial [Elusimicrobiota bacterium]|nr:autotransporter outer membrane beta-barrel domain-containing protein [Elusimicrobiota bacterium]
ASGAGQQFAANTSGARALELEANYIEANNNADYGLELGRNGIVTASNGLSASGNGGSGVSVLQEGYIGVSGGNIALNNNGYQDGLYGAGLYLDSAAADFSGGGSFSASGNKKTSAFDIDGVTPLTWERGYGLYLNKTAAVTIQNMDINLDNNGYYGLYLYRGSTAALTGRADGVNTFSASGNANSTWANGYGLSVENSSSAIIENMDVTLDNNALYGVNVNGGAVTFTGSAAGGNNFSASGNRAPADARGGGLYAGGANSSISVTGMDNIFLNNNGANGGAGASGGVLGSGRNITLEANYIEANGNKGYGFLLGDGSSIISRQGISVSNNGGGLALGGANSTAIITGGDVFANNNADGIGLLAAQGAQINITGNGSNVLEIYDNGEYGISARDAGSVIDITGMRVSGRVLAESLLAIEGDGGVISIKDGSVATTNGNLFYVAGGLTGGKKYVLFNSSAVSEGDSLMISDAQEALLEATGSYLENAVITKDYKNLNISLSDSLWLMKDSSNLTQLVAANSAIDLRAAAPGRYNTLKVESWSGDNSSLYLNTYFDGDGTSTDKLVVDGGAATGDATLFITSVGTNGAHSAANGIKVVDLTNAAEKSAQFTLNGGRVDTGALEYTLAQAEDENWYLTTGGALSDTANAVNNIPALHLSMVKVGMNELNKRLGDLRMDGGQAKPGVWARSYGRHLEVDEKVSATATLFGFEAGADIKLQSARADFYLGLMGGYMHSDNVKVEQRNTFHGSGRTSAPSIGAYAAWLHDNGWFADATLRHFWVDMDMKSISSGGAAVDYGAKRGFYTASLEGGRRFRVSSFILNPKLEVKYAFADHHNHSTNFEDNISYDDTNSFETKLSLQVAYSGGEENPSLKPYAQIGVHREWDGKTDITFSSERMKSDIGGLGLELMLGLNAKIYPNAYIYLNAAYDHGEVFEAISGNLGVRYSF